MKSSDFSMYRRSVHVNKILELIKLKNRLGLIKGMPTAITKLGASYKVAMTESFVVIWQLDNFLYNQLQSKLEDGYDILVFPTKLQVIEVYSKMKEQI